MKVGVPRLDSVARLSLCRIFEKPLQGVDEGRADEKIGK